MVRAIREKIPGGGGGGGGRGGGGRRQPIYFSRGGWCRHLFFKLIGHWCLKKADYIDGEYCCIPVHGFMGKNGY